MNYVVIDLEMCMVPNRLRQEYGKSYETIQIGAVLLNENYEITDKFNTYVRPEYGFINSFIQNLTGIEQRKIAAAPSFEQALMNLLRWIPAGDVQMASWSMTDREQIRREMQCKEIRSERLEQLFQNWFDVQEQFSRRLASTRTYKLSEAVARYGIEAEGQAHDALADAHNTALVFAKMNRKQTFYKKGSVTTAFGRKERVQSCTLGELMKGLVG